MEAVAGFPKLEAKAIGLIGFAHMLSHVYPLALPPLLIPITQSLQISTVEWGIALGVYAITTGVLQTPAGLLIERVGGRKILVAGLLIYSAAYFLIGWQASSFLELALLMGLAGIGNSVFHPVDYSLISSSIAEERLGRAFSIHTFVGHVGFLAGPILSASLEPFIGWRGAMMSIGGIGLALTVVLIVFGGLITEGNKVKKAASVGDRLKELLTSKPIILFFLFYMAASMANFGVTQFSIAVFDQIYDFPRATAVIALTAYQIATMALVLPGGLLADKTTRYDAVLLIGFGIAALMVFLAGLDFFPFWLIVVMLSIGGAMRGAVNACRDVAVRHVAVHIPVGVVFGFVSTGFLAGQAVAGPVYGWLFDNYPPHYVFFASAAFTLLAMLTVVFNTGTRREAAPVGEQADK